MGLFDKFAKNWYNALTGTIDYDFKLMGYCPVCKEMRDFSYRFVGGTATVPICDGCGTENNLEF
jgi:hypothetical protein